MDMQLWMIGTMRYLSECQVCGRDSPSYASLQESTYNDQISLQLGLSITFTLARLSPTYTLLDQYTAWTVHTLPPLPTHTYTLYAVISKC